MAAPPSRSIESIELTRDASDPWRLTDVGTACTAALSFPPMLVGALGLGPGRPCGLIGAAGAGKNLLVQSIGLSVATGRKVLGLYPCRTGRVLHITYDLGLTGTVLRYRQLANGLGIAASELEERIAISAHPKIDLTHENAATKFAAVMRRFDLVIVDHLRAAVPGVDENSSQFGGFVSVLNAAGEMAGTTIIALMHTTKAGDSYRGSSAIEASCGTLWQLDGKGSEARSLECKRTHDTYAEPLPPKTITLTASNSGSIDVPASPDAPQGQMPKALLLTAIEGRATAAGRKPGKFTPDQLAKVREAVVGMYPPGERVSGREVRDATGLRQVTVYACLRELEGEVVKPIVDPETGESRATGWTRC